MSVYMQRAIELAQKGFGFVNPNPAVGAVIVKDNRIIGEGYHTKYGNLHAEREAIKSLKESAKGADMYVTLEPCCHYGKNPPCTEAVIESGVKRVFVGSYDPNPLVAGKGIQILRDAGIEVVEGFMQKECDALNEIFFHYITNGEPYIIMKTAVTADGKTACANGDSKWITNELSRANVQLTRKRCAAILTGIGTVLADDPMLNCRCENPSNPVRVICDSGLRIPMQSQIVRTAKEIPTIVATLSEDCDKIKQLQNANIEVIKTKSFNGRIDLNELIAELGKRKLDSVMVEAGAALNAAVMDTGKVNQLDIYIAPKLVGGIDSIPFLGGNSIEKMSMAIKLRNPQIKTFGDDIMISYKVGE